MRQKFFSMFRRMLEVALKTHRTNVPWLTVDELAVALRMSVKSVRRAYRRDEIPVERIGRFVRFDLKQVKQAMQRNDARRRKLRLRLLTAAATAGASRRRGRQIRPRTVKRGRNFQGKTRRPS